MSSIYIDLDYTLGYAVFLDAERTEVDHYVFRPGAHEFLSALRPYGDLVILTASTSGWAEDALSARPDLRKLISKVIQGDDMKTVQYQLDMIFGLKGVTGPEKRELVSLIQPLAPPGIVFDDVAVGSEYYILKSVSIGTFDLGKNLWIQVEKFSSDDPDHHGLEKAFMEFKKRNTGWIRKGAEIGRNNRKGVDLQPA